MNIREFFASLSAKRETSKILIDKALSDANDAQQALLTLLKSSKRYQLTVKQWIDVIKRHPTQVDVIFASFGPQKRFFGLITDRRHLGYRLTNSQQWQTLLDGFNSSANTSEQFGLRSLTDKMLQFAPATLEKWEGQVAKQDAHKAELQAELRSRLPGIVKTQHNKTKVSDTAKAVINNPKEYKLVQQRLHSLDLAREPKGIKHSPVEIQKTERSLLSLSREVASRVDRFINSWLRKEKYQAAVQKLTDEKQSLNYAKASVRLNALDMGGVKQPSDIMAQLPLAHLDLANKSAATTDIKTAPKLPSAVKLKLNKLLQTPAKHMAQASIAIAGTPLSSHSSEKTMSLKRVAASESLADDVTVYSGLSDFEGIDSLEFYSSVSQNDDYRLNEDEDPVFDREEIEYREGKYDDEFSDQPDWTFETPKKRVSSKLSSIGSSPLENLTRVFASPMTDDSSIDLQRVVASPFSSPGQSTPEVKMSGAGSATPFCTLNAMERVYPETDTPDSGVSELVRVTESPSDGNSTQMLKSKSSVNNLYRQFSNTSSCKASRTGGYGLDDFDKGVARRLFADDEEETNVREMPMLT